MKIEVVLALTLVIFASILFCLVGPLAPAVAQLNIETSLSSTISVGNGVGHGFVLSRDGSTIAVSMRGNKIDLWNGRTGKRIGTLQADVDAGEDPQDYLPQFIGVFTGWSDTRCSCEQ